MAKVIQFPKRMGKRGDRIVVVKTGLWKRSNQAHPGVAAKRRLDFLDQWLDPKMFIDHDK